MSNIEKCPTCDTELEIEDSAYDQPLECPKCKAEIMIPRPVVIPRAVKVHRTETAPRIPQSSPIVVIVKGVDISLLDAIRLIGVFLAASFILGVIGALIWLLVWWAMSFIR
jgi:DNA-directed RNA polymerase subunit RPC12/RpoP